MAVGGCRKARLLSDYLLILRHSFNFTVPFPEEFCTGLFLMVTEQKIIAADTYNFLMLQFFSFAVRTS